MFMIPDLVSRSNLRQKQPTGISFLADDASEYLTGVTLNINGGSHLH